MDKDLDLRNLLLEGDIFILDRGFRDALKLLKEKFKLETMMPSLLPQNQKQFTTNEANESRLCTKLRWVVESDNGLLKGRFRVLDHRVENKSLPHFLEDIRIAGALVNKYSKRLLSDNGNALEMARNMLQNKNKENELRDLVEEKRLHRKSQFVEIACNETEFDDFPKLSIDCMQSEITYGSYQLSQSLSYLSEQFSKNGSYLILGNKHKLTQDGSKIISTKIQSRHSSAKQYRVYIRYLPISKTTTERPDHIKGWYCECKNGARTLGCCCHIAALLYYLAYARHVNHQSLKNPALFLNSIFPKEVHEPEEDAVESRNLKQSKQQKRTKNSTEFDVSSSDYDENVNEDGHNENKSLSARELIPKSSSSTQKSKQLRPSRSVQHINRVNPILDMFYLHSPVWGGQIAVVENLEHSIQYRDSSIINTCSFDYFLFGLWLSTKLSRKIKEFLADSSQVTAFDKASINLVIDSIEQNKWNEAKTVWILKFLKMTPNKEGQFSTYSDTFRVFGRILSSQQLFFADSKCSCCDFSQFKESTEFYFNHDANNNLIYELSFGDICPLCNQKMDGNKGRFSSNPAWLFFDVNYNHKSFEKVNCSELPKVIQINELSFKLLCCQIIVNEQSKAGAHFKGIFLIDDSFYLIDDLKKDVKLNVPTSHKVTNCLYYLNE